jgi:hypothetical protein
MMNETLIHPGAVSCPIWVSFRLILSLDGEGSDVFTSHEREKLKAGKGVMVYRRVLSVSLRSAKGG